MTTCDAFLGGKVQAQQPARGFRAGIDAVLLAASCPAKPGQTVLELGCGVGVASLCLAARVPVRIVGVEVQPEYAALARENAAANAAPLSIIDADLRDLPAPLRQQCFDHVIMNPPYYDRRHGTEAQDTGRDVALGGATPLSDWLRIAAKRLAPKGWLTMIQRMDRLPDIIAGLPTVMGSVTVQPIAPRHARDAHLVLLRARKEGRSPFVMHAPLILHQGDAHPGDQEAYTPQVRSILRDGAALTWGGN